MTEVVRRVDDEDGASAVADRKATSVDFKIELVFVPVTDVDSAKHFYADQLGWPVDHDQTVSDEIRFVQITPPGSACSIAFGKGLNDMAPGSQRSVQIVVADADAARQHLLDGGVEASEVDDQPWGRFVTFSDPDGNRWTLQQLPQWSQAAPAES
jgi:predicted enzyme related to lactoylglutathione lyase